MVDASCGETFMLKSEDEAWAMFENLSNNFCQQVSNRQRAPTPKAPKTESLFEVRPPADMATQVVDAITKKLDQLMTAGFALNVAHISTQLEPCSFCFSTMHQVNRSMQPSLDQVTIHIPTLTTQGGEIIQISPGRVQIQKTTQSSSVQ
jgi:hypothetical protein